ncbi:MAG: transketolase [Candidatus Buchananbacteria bacterium CG10_big_fil_rev_8_21_14_0_10_42_9]|uniref:Transketolase n=1 Tax=Candidatus Buchananbacteria bacterium CG10_big_fil_rev_8_21_14_0_10_42_9 TaxID=1974526 RepID=A0A2H0W1P7_9BACT|nr:MAG: transketolase [Candidatus Buchananbacteria bacterium CG10_big_fil_rev_8_21_14_0_10_42_9]
MPVLRFIPKKEIERVVRQVNDRFSRAALLADIFRINTLSMIMEAGSGHLGSSFSSLDIVVWLWTNVMKNPNQPNEQESDTFFSSKGHDAPGLYAALIGLGYLDYEKIHQLRRLGGLPGHPDIHTPYIAFNTGSLGMGISKARGLAHARRLERKAGRFYVMTGDGELQEGQIWESLQPAVNHKMSEITVIIDHNKLQSDIEIKHVSDLGDLESKFKAFGWAVFRVDGHDLHEFSQAIEQAKQTKDKPQVIIADTVKGKGSSITEPKQHTSEDELYNFHAGAPAQEDYQKIWDELAKRVNGALIKLGLEKLKYEEHEISPNAEIQHPQRLISAYESELAALGKEHDEIVVLDGDLMKDTGQISFKKEFPDRFLECGIAEQDMVSVAGGLARGGKLPVVHSFACFLSTRPNEHIYNNATEETKIIYVGSLAGLLPGGPGHSHQSVRDISALGSVPGLTLVEPSSEKETQMALRWAVKENDLSTYIRMVSVPVETPFELPAGYKLVRGQGVKILDGTDIVIFAYGPVLLSEAVKAAELLNGKGVSAAIYNLPWLNVVNTKWLREVTQNFNQIFTLDNHYATFGQGSLIAAKLDKPVISFGLNKVPECGSNQEVLEHHKLDAASLARRIEKNNKA